MCGIVGVYHRDKRCDAATLDRMRDVLSHRGPDAAGSYVDGPLGLGHRRLSIIDLGSGQQPMQTEDGGLVIVFNGEIYNFRELRADLERRGVRFRSHSDTEVILRLHALEGDAAVTRLNGIFAYALWDSRARRLLLARDRAGIKPLYYHSAPDGFAFASEIKALFESGLVAPSLDPGRVGEYLVFRQVAGEQNLLAGVSTLLPGHTMEILDGRVSGPVRYWSVHTPVPAFHGSYQDAIDALDGTLNRAVARQLMADVPLGTFCSGGIDSSLTTAIAARHAGRKINTYSVGFHEAGYDESAYARMAADACDTAHHELRIKEREYVALLPKLVWHHDLPLNFANSVHIFAVSKLARQDVTVVLTGEGADELFGGYPRYYIPRIMGRLARVPGPLRAATLAVLARIPDHRARKLGKLASRSDDELLLYNSTGVDPAVVAAMLGARTQLPLHYREQSIGAARDLGLDPVSALARLDFQTYLVSILDRQDKMSMATSLEARVPFLDNEVIDFAASLPLEYKQTFRHRKRILKEVALRYLPEPIVNRRKSGFGVPLQPWMKERGPLGTLLEDAIHGEPVVSLLDAKALVRMLKEHRSGAADHSELLWSVLNLSVWRQAFRV